MRPRHRSIIFALLTLACREAAAPAPPRLPAGSDVVRAYVGPTCTISWNDPVSGSWRDATRWDLGRVPTYSDVVCITEPGQYSVQVGMATASRVVVGDGLSHISLISAPHPWGATFPILDFGPLTLRTGAFIQLQDLNAILALDADSGSVISVANNTTVGGLRTFGLDSDIELLTGATLSLQMATNWYNGRIDKGRISGDGHIYINGGSDGEAEDLSWSGGTIETRPSPPYDPIVVARGVSLHVSDDAVGTIDVDPAGEPMEITGVVGAAARVRVRRAQWVSPATVTFGIGVGYPFTVGGRLEILDQTGQAMTLRGSIDNERTTSIGPGRITLAIDSIVNAGHIVVADSLNLTSGAIRNAGTISLQGTASDLVVGPSADFVAETAGNVIGTLSLAGGRLGGSGTLARVVSSGGTVSPGSNHLGSLTFGTLTLDAVSRVIFDVRGTTPGTYDQVWINGHVQRAGMFEARGNGSFTAGLCGQVIPLLVITRGASTTGSFNQFSGLSLALGRAWRVVSSTSGNLLVGHDPTRALGLSSGSIALSEGGGGATTLACLGSPAPTAPVDVRVLPRFGQVAGPPSQPLFTLANWALPQSIRVDAIDDAVPEPVHIDSVQFVLSSADPAYAGTASAQLAATITDNDVGPDLSVVLVASPTTVTVNQVFEARYRVTNHGPVASTGSTFRIVPLAGMTLQNNTSEVSCSSTVGGSGCTVGALAVGASVEFTIVYRAGTPGSYTNDVSIAGHEYDGMTANNVVVWNIAVN